MESIHISSHVENCGRSFFSLVEALKDAPRFAAQMIPEVLNDEIDRFRIWAGNIAAHRKGRRSLEYRLRDAAHLKHETCNLLEALHESLTDALAIVKGERTPWDELSDSDTDSESDGWLDKDGLQGDTELKQLKSSIKNTVTCLFRLSMAIRDPAPHSQSRSTITVDKSFFEEFDVQHVREKFPACEDFLFNRLGRAISGRRQYLTYREEHHKKLAKNVEKIGYEEPRTEHTTNSTEASLVPKEQDVIDDCHDALSQTSYATSVNVTLRVPPLPKEAKDHKHFECPLCFMIILVHTTAEWKQHVYRDLHPYCCTFRQCATADRLYDSRHAWFNHEMDAHRTVWQCVDGCEKTFSSEDDLTVHVRTLHPEIAGDNLISAIKQTAVRSVNTMERAICPVCGKHMRLRALQKHLGHHQEQLALFALPPNLDATDDQEEQLSKEIQFLNEDDSPIESNDTNSEENYSPRGRLLREVDEWTVEDGLAESEDAKKAAEDAKFSRIEQLLIEQQQAQVQKEADKKKATEEATAMAAEAKEKGDEDKLARLEQLILALKEDQLEREEALAAQHAADKVEHDAKVAKEAAEKKAQAEAAAQLLEAAKKALKEAEAKAAKEAEEAKAEHEKALAEAKAAAEELEKAKKAAEEEAAKLKSNNAPKPPIKFKDAVGRKFSFPWHFCKTWKGMEELIKQAFLNVDVIGPQVHEGHYDLVGPDGEIILPHVWETMVQPGWAITMHMWPMPEPPLSPPPPPPPPPPQTPIAKLDAIASKLYSEVVPLCVTFMQNPPAEKLKKDFEYKKLSETILTQILMKLDVVGTEGDQDARMRRKELVKEAQGMLKKLDGTVK